jgi:hypothetical protein
MPGSSGICHDCQPERMSLLMNWLTLVEFSFYLVETFALPFAIIVFLIERRKERAAEAEELYQRLSDEYTNFLKLVLDNADLQLLRKSVPAIEGNEEQLERKFALFGILVSIFERAYLLVYDEHMNKQARRLWCSWEDYMREWCRRPDFRRALPELLEGEDPEFRAYIEEIARTQAALTTLGAASSQPTATSPLDPQAEIRPLVVQKK